MFRTLLEDKECTLPPGHQSIGLSLSYTARALCMQDKHEVEGISGLAIEVDEDRHAREKEKTLNVVYC
jgi:hypothetical protein